MIEPLGKCRSAISLRGINRGLLPRLQIILDWGMKTLRLCLIACGLLTGLISTSAEEKTLTLEDIIFDAKYVGEFLGPKTLLQLKGDAGPVLAALAKTDLPAKTTFMLLPAQATPAKPKFETPPNLPESRKWQDMEATASFLIFVSAEGKMESLYCYDQNDRVYALLVSHAITKWRFNAAKFGDTALPVLYQHTATFSGMMIPTRNDSSNRNNNMGSPANTPMPKAAP